MVKHKLLNTIILYKGKKQRSRSIILCECFWRKHVFKKIIIRVLTCSYNLIISSFNVWQRFQMWKMKAKHVFVKEMNCDNHFWKEVSPVMNLENKIDHKQICLTQ
jgi:hypothetical protein